MRMRKGLPFKDTRAEWAPDDYEGEGTPRVFSEVFLYDAVGKDDARFILGVADEYDHVIAALGPAAVKAILDVKPRLVERLGTGKVVVEHLADARDWRDLMMEEQHPSEVTLDSDTAEGIWKLLHSEYRRTFNPEESMDADLLRAYHVLTDALGSWEQEQREKEQTKLPEKLKLQKERRTELARAKQIKVLVDGEDDHHSLPAEYKTRFLKDDADEVTITLKRVAPKKSKKKGA